jgi:serine/threonine-protein kinase
MSDALRAELETALGSAYQIDRELTGGGMSRVFAATERALGRKVVVKVLPPDLAAGVNRERFQREIRLSAQLQHPHIVPLLSAGEQGHLLWYTMPYIDGESLRAEIDRRGRLPVRDVMRIVTDVAEALAFAHSRGVIHRDIKPGNVLLQGNHALVTDFGVAKALSAALPSGAGTSTGMAIGTPTYMAPEQLASDPAADHRVDIYALGLLAYELLTGASPFESPSPRETMAAQLTRMPPSLDSSNPEVTPALARVVSDCLQKDPDRRPATAEELLGRLEGLGSGAVASRGPVSSRARMLGLVVAGAAAAAALLWFRSDAPPRTAAAPDSVAPAAAVQDTVVVREAVPVPLTRADSLAIARAVEQRAGGSGAPSLGTAQLESLKIQLERAMAESLSRALAQLQRQPPRQSGATRPGEPARTWTFDTSRGAPMTFFVKPPNPPPTPSPGPPVAIVYPVHFDGPVDAALASAIVPARDSLLRVVRDVPGLEVVDLDSLTRSMHQRATEVAIKLRNSFQIIGMFHSVGDSVLFRVDVRPPGWPVRGRVMQVESPMTPRQTPLVAVEAVATKLAAILRTGAGRSQRRER